MRYLLIIKVIISILLLCGCENDKPKIAPPPPAFNVEKVSEKLEIWTEIKTGIKYLYYVNEGTLVPMPKA